MLELPMQFKGATINQLLFHYINQVFFHPKTDNKRSLTGSVMTDDWVGRAILVRAERKRDATFAEVVFLDFLHRTRQQRDKYNES